MSPDPGQVAEEPLMPRPRGAYDSAMARAATLRILGIDPGLNVTGYGVAGR